MSKLRTCAAVIKGPQGRVPGHRTHSVLCVHQHVLRELHTQQGAAHGHTVMHSGSVELLPPLPAAAQPTQGVWEL